MSQENEALLRAGYDALNSGDIAGWIATFHPDAELHELASVPDTAVYKGHDELQKWVESIFDVAEDFGFEVEQFIDAGEFTVARVRASGRGRIGGVPVETHVFHVFEIDGGKIRRVRGYLDEAEALEAAGLRE
jgi:ketosteroid isomerase-like protein